VGATRTLVGTVLALALVFGRAAAWADDVSDGDAAFHNGEYSKAVKLLLPLARHGDAVAQRDVGLMYFGGNGLAHDSREAVKWFSLSARQGQIGAQVNLGIAYATGEGVQRDPVQAYVWFNAAASQRIGNSVAAKFRDHMATELSPDQLQGAESIAARCQATSYSDCSME
jgi:TPR repeat protein